MPSYNGLLRWTPIEGADSYQVWLIDTGKMEIVRTNVLDEREFYTFHQAPAWIGTVRWRIRALRGDVFNYRVNGMPVAMYGAWSPIYSSSNPAVTDGPITLTGTVSDVFSDGSQLFARASVHAGVHVEGRPGRERLDSGALPRLHLHRQAVPEPRLLERRRRQPGLVAAP